MQVVFVYERRSETACNMVTHLVVNDLARLVELGTVPTSSASQRRTAELCRSRASNATETLIFGAVGKIPPLIDHRINLLSNLVKERGNTLGKHQIPDRVSP